MTVRADVFHWKLSKVYPNQTFSTEAMFDVLTGIAHRLENLFRQKGYVKDDDSMNDVEQDSDVPLPLSPRVSKSYRRNGLLEMNPNYKNQARSSATLLLLKYVTPEDPDRSDMELQLKREWKDGAKSLLFTQRDLVEALASLIPQPWFDLTRNCVRAPAEYWLPWAELLRRTVGVDPEICSCGARMVIDDAITDAETIAETLTRMGISTVGPPKVARSAGELDYVYDV